MDYVYGEYRFSLLLGTCYYFQIITFSPESEKLSSKQLVSVLQW